jgi:TRAP-type C4-dicarboxylate transport system permease small subunit
MCCASSPAIPWINIVAAGVVVLYNLAGLPYKGWYDNFLIGVSFIFNGLTIWFAWNWSAGCGDKPAAVEGSSAGGRGQPAPPRQTFSGRLV